MILTSRSGKEQRVRAVVCRELGNDAAVTVETVPDPVAGESDVRIAVCASGVSLANRMMLAGTYQIRPNLPFVPGTEASGVVIGCGAAVTRFRPGDRVTTGIRHGGFAEQLIAPERNVFAIPDAIDHHVAMQIPMVYGTAYGALKWRARLEAGETVLVHGAVGDSGMAAVEVARCLGGRVIATATTEAKAAACRRHGADVVINLWEQPFRDAVLAMTEGRGADVVFDPVGGAVFAESLRCIAPEGRLVTMGFVSGGVPQVPANILLIKNFDVIGVYWGYYLGWERVAPRPRHPDRVRSSMAEMLAWCEHGLLRPEVYERFRLDDFRAALDALVDANIIGRVALSPLTEPLIEQQRLAARAGIPITRP